MPRERSPRLTVDITPEIWDAAVQASSGSCLIADAIKTQYPQYSGVTVDAVTVRLSDKETGKRYSYLTPASARDLLLWFDQGWSYPSEHTVRLRTPVKVDVIKRDRPTTARRAERKSVLTAKREAGEPMSRAEKGALTVMEKEDALHEPRPHTQGPITDVIPRREGNATVVGGKTLPRPPKNPNLLAGRNRIFGAKTAKPAAMFEAAVEAALAERSAEAGTEGATRNDPAST
jgi:hypothetical protein